MFSLLRLIKLHTGKNVYNHPQCDTSALPRQASWCSLGVLATQTRLMGPIAARLARKVPALQGAAGARERVRERASQPGEIGRQTRGPSAAPARRDGARRRNCQPPYSDIIRAKGL